MAIRNMIPKLKNRENKSRLSFISRHPAIVLCLVLTLLVVALHLNNTEALERYEMKLYDFMFKMRGMTKPSGDVVILAIDDKAIEYLGDWPWNHQVLAQLVEALTYYHPRCVAFRFPIKENVHDFVSGMSQLLAENILQSGNIILPFYPTLSARTPNTKTAAGWLSRSTLNSILPFEAENVPKASRIDLASEMFARSAVTSAALLSQFDSDNHVRRQPLIVRFERNLYPSIELAAAARHVGASFDLIKFDQDAGRLTIGDILIPVDNKGQSLIRFYGPVGSFPSYSVKDFWDGELQVDQIRNKTVLVALTASAITDSLSTPVGDDFTPAETSANVINNIIAGEFISPLNSSTDIEFFIILLIGILSALALPRIGTLYRFLVLGVICLALFTFSFVMFTSFSTYVDIVYPIVLLMLMAVASPLMSWNKPSDRYDSAASSRSSAEATTKTTKESTSSPAPERNRVKPHGIARDRNIPDEVDQNSEETEFIDELGQKPPRMDRSKVEHATPDAEHPVEPERSRISASEDEAGSDSESDGIYSTNMPESFGRYVYKGKDPAIGRLVALKTIRVDKIADASEVDELRERLNREAKAAGNLSHPNIVTIYDVGLDGDTQYIAMEFLKGFTLEQVISRQLQLNFKIAAKVVFQICSALSYAHKHNIVHRDIKPANIMVLENFHVKVMDFGIARFESSSLTRTGIAMGTPSYISPEQLKGEEVTPSSDIFSLGVVLYEMVCGKKPFVGEGISNLIMKIINDDPAMPSSISDGIPPILDLIVKKALAKNPYDRYQSADEFSHALEDFAVTFSEKRTSF
jgi:serine/threonine-protein kinase